MKKAVTGMILTLLLMGMLTLAINVHLVKAEPRTWIVDDNGPADFHTIQEAIDASNPGDTIYVRVGIYYENIDMNPYDIIYNGEKERTSRVDLSIVGEDNERTIIDANGGGWGIAFFGWNRNILVKSFTILNGSKGIFIQQQDGGPENVHIENCIISKNYVGIDLETDNPNGVTISQNIIEHNTIGIDGSGLRAVCRTTISGNIIKFNDQYGIRLACIWSMFGNVLSGNTITNNGYGGIYLFSPSDTWLEIEWTGNTISNNTIENNGYFGIKLDTTYNDVIYHNNFVNNPINAIVDGVDSYLYLERPNRWDDGYPSGGNFWSDYTGVDEKSGPNQDQPGSDSIGDTPYVIDDYNRDRYSLMKPWTPTPPPPPVITATIDIDPNTLNLRSKGKWITAYIELPKGYNVADINISSILLNETISAQPKPVAIGDYDGDGVPDLMVKFNKTAVSKLILSKGLMTGNVTLTITGKLTHGILFEGSDIIRVKDARPKGH